MYIYLRLCVYDCVRVYMYVYIGTHSTYRASLWVDALQAGLALYKGTLH